MSIRNCLNQIQENIEKALQTRTVPPLCPDSGVKLLAITKNQGVPVIEEAIRNGITAIGENRLQEALQKHAALPEVELHLVGHLQTNKVKQAVRLFHLIHSIDSEKLVNEVDKAAGSFNTCQDILLQVNVAGEETKYGVTPQEVISLGRRISDLEHVRLCGLMTIAPYYETPEEARPIFSEMYQLFKELESCQFPGHHLKWLSMGMTNDYIVAVEEGANIVRIGTGIFGQRQY